MTDKQDELKECRAWISKSSLAHFKKHNYVHARIDSEYREGAEDCPVIILTDSDLRKREEEAFRAGCESAVAYLEKEGLKITVVSDFADYEEEKRRGKE